MFLNSSYLDIQSDRLQYARREGNQNTVTWNSSTLILLRTIMLVSTYRMRFATSSSAMSRPSRE